MVCCLIDDIIWFHLIPWQQRSHCLLRLWEKCDIPTCEITCNRFFPRALHCLYPFFMWCAPLARDFKLGSKALQWLYPSCACTQARPWQWHLIATLPRVCWGQPQAAGGAQSHPSLNNIILISLNRKMTDDDEDGESKSSKIWNAFQAVVSLMSGGGVGVGDRLDTLDTDLVQEKFWCTNSVRNYDAQIVLKFLMHK